MNTTKLCNRFERDGIMQIERGLPLDSHFDRCDACGQARTKYSAIFGALPKSNPDVAPPVGWQSRVLQAAAEKDARKPAFWPVSLDKSNAWSAMAVAAAVAVAALSFAPRTTQFEVQAETQVASSPALPDPALAQPAPSEPEVAPAPQPVAPKSQPKPVHAAPSPPAVKNADSPAQVESPKPAPAAPTATPQSAAPKAVERQAAERSSGPHVVRPDKLYGFSLNYPRAAMAAKVQGEVSAQCTIRSDGRNTNCRILKSLPFLDEPVLRALAAARTDPIKVNGKAVDNSDHIWHITIKLREAKEAQTLGRGIPVVTWSW